MIKRPKHPSPPYHLYPSKTFLGQLKWTESTRIHDTSYRPLDQPRNQIQRLDIDQDQDNGQSKDKTGTNRNSMIRSAIIKRLLGGSFPFSSVPPSSFCNLLYFARFYKLLCFARDPIFSTVVSAPSLQMSPSGSVEAKTDRPQMFRLAL